MGESVDVDLAVLKNEIKHIREAMERMRADQAESNARQAESNAKTAEAIAAFSADLNERRGADKLARVLIGLGGGLTGGAAVKWGAAILGVPFK